MIGFSSETGSSVKSSDYQYGEISYNENIYGQPATKTRTEIYSFAHVSFINEPKSSIEHVSAKKVWAEIEFYNSAKKLRWGNIKGRWSDTTQPVLPNQVKRNLLEVDFEPNQLEWELDIATRHVNETVGFVFNNESYEFAEFMRNDMVLQEDLYFVKIVLRGVGLKPEGEKFCFKLDNKTVGGFEISEIDCF